MSKKVLLILGVALVVVIAGLFWLNSRGRTLSPSGSANITDEDLTVTIKYSRPSMRGRVVFGPEGSDALLPYGKYWRLGANEPTTIEFNRDVTFGGRSVPKGKYRMYAFPGENSFAVVLNTEISAWGYSEPDYSKDLVKIEVPVAKQESLTEQFTIEFTKAETVQVEIKWSDVLLTIPIGK